MTVSGFIGKPEFARKVRGEQMFFVNHRFIKSNYLHHAVMAAFDELLPKETFPFYCLFIEMDPQKININVHPTKQEIKFDDERLVYNYLKVAIRHALGKYSITPSLDFEQETSFNTKLNVGSSIGTLKQAEFEREMTESLGSTGKKDPSGFSAPPPREKKSRDTLNLANWHKLFEGLEAFEAEMDTGRAPQEDAITVQSNWSSPSENLPTPGSLAQSQKEPCQIHASYIVSQIKSGFILIDQQAAHERILYERYLDILESSRSLTQKELFPRTLNFSAQDAELLKEMLPSIQMLGFDIQEFGKDAFIIYGVPADLKPGADETKLIESMLNQYRDNQDIHIDRKENVARAMAKSAAVPHGQNLTVAEMSELIDKLFACSSPYKSPAGRNCFITFELKDLADKFKA
jgi:DNA mismatch repair protein MutL